MNGDSPDHDHENHRSVLEGEALGQGMAFGWQENSTVGPIHNAQSTCSKVVDSEAAGHTNNMVRIINLRVNASCRYLSSVVS
jgi:hypothetical protein